MGGHHELSIFFILHDNTPKNGMFNFTLGQLGHQVTNTSGLAQQAKTQNTQLTHKGLI